MKKHFLIFLLTFPTFLAFGQQVPLNGVVRIHNSKFETGKTENVQFAAVSENRGRAQVALTKANGEFKLVLIGIAPDSSFSFQVKKDGLEVVNISELEAVAGQLDKVEIFMSEPQYLADFRDRIYEVGKTSAEKALEKKQSKLMAELKAEKGKNERNENRIRELSNDLSRVFSELSKLEERANELADKYARVNLDLASERYQKAFDFFQKGELDQATLLLQASVKNAEAIFAERERISNTEKELEERKKEERLSTKTTSQELRVKADAHYSKGEWDSVSVTYEILLLLDSTDVDNLYEAAHFLSRQNEHERAIQLYEKALGSTKNKMQTADIHLELGLLYQSTQRLEEAENAFLTTYELRKELAEENPNEYLVQLSPPLVNLGNLYAEKKQFEAAAAAYQESLDFLEAAAKKDPELYVFQMALRSSSNLAGLVLRQMNIQRADSLFHATALFLRELALQDDSNLGYLAASLNNLAIVSGGKGAFAEAEKYGLEAVEIQRGLHEQNQSVQLPDLAEFLNTLGGALFDNGKNAEAENVYRESLGHYRELTLKSPDAFRPKVALVLNNLANLLASTPTPQRLEEADAAYQKALRIYREEAHHNPDVFLPDVAMSLNNLGRLHEDRGWYNQAEKAYREAISIYRKIREEKPGLPLPDYVTVLKNQAKIEFIRRDWPEAVRILEEALKQLQLQLQFTEESATEQMDKMAFTLADLGLANQHRKEFEQSEQYYQRAILIMRMLANGNPTVFNIELVNTAINLCRTRKEMMEANGKPYKAKECLSLLDEAEEKLKIYTANEVELGWYAGTISELKTFFQNTDPQKLQEDKLRNSIAEKQALVRGTKNPADALAIQRGIVQLKEELLSLYPDDKASKHFTAEGYGSLAWCLLQNNERKAAGKAAKKGLKLSPDETFSNLSYCLSLLYNGKWKKARPIVEKRKDEAFTNGATWGQLFLQMLGVLEKGGVLHPDIVKAKHFLK